MTDKQLKKEFYKTRLVKEGGSCFECCDYEGIVKNMWEFINKNYISKEWVDKKLIGEDEFKVSGRNPKEWKDKEDSVIRNEFKQLQRLKLKEKEDK